MVSNVLTYLKASYEKYPQKTALSDACSSVSYSELWEKACAIGSAISRFMNGTSGEPVFVCIDRRIESIIAFFGVVCSGNFYVPIDPSLPEKRLEDIFNTMQPKLCIASVELKKPLPFECETVSMDELLKEQCDYDLPDRTIRSMLDTDPLYCIFTSGSTGIPKGVLISHRSVIDMAEQFVKTFGFDKHTVFGNQAPFDFDVSVKDIYISICCGGTVHVLEKQLFMMVKRLIQRLNDHRVNTIIWAASAMKIVSALKTFDKIVPEHLERIMFSGEALPCKVLNDWASHMPDAKFVNLYGPTEITCNCTYYKIERKFDDNEAIPIGKAFENTGILLLNGCDPVNCGEIGEICVRGTCLALGYYNDPERTAAAFCQNPMQKYYPERIYRTGDLAKYDENGDLIFLGRADSQIKHMGHRIEMGEIELAANAIGFITSACCLYDEANEKLMLFYQSDEQDDKAVFAELKKVLPVHMVPNKLVYMKAMPANRTGKIDRALLKKTYINI